MATVEELARALRGYGETALTLGSGAVSAPVGGIAGVFKNVTSPQFGTQEGIKIANDEAKRIMDEYTYAPRSVEGQQNLQAINKLFEASKLPPVMPELAPLAGMRPAAKQTKGVANGAEQARPITTEGVGFFDTGDIRRVGKHKSDIDPRGLSPDDLGAVQGLIELPSKRGLDNGARLAELLRNPDINPAVINAKQINPDFDLVSVLGMPKSSLLKQYPIAKTYETMAKSIDPDLEKILFNQYLEKHPDLVRQSGATNYRELIPASYEQLGKENAIQLDRMLNDGIKLSYHKGDMNYANSPEMLQDALINKHIYTFGGGEPHELLNKVDPYTGLNENQTFRAVHDYYGHGTTGSSFGPLGEEVAFGAHSQLYSPLAKLAAATETRGQNSFVNYSGVNADLHKKILDLKRERDALQRQGQDISAYQKRIGELGEQTQYADQKAFILPPEMVDLNYKGGMPEYMKPFIKPNNPESVEAFHWSNKPDLERTDPSKYGSGIKGKEAGRLSEPGAVKDRTYFYTDSEKREPGLGINQYSAALNNMYNTDLDLDNLDVLSDLYSRYQGILDKEAKTNAVERLAKEAGYEGVVNSLGAISFEPQDLKKRK